MSKIVVTWPDSQYLMNFSDYREHSKLINGERGLEEYGSCAYLVDEEWWDSLGEENEDWDEEDLDNETELEECYDDELEALGFLDEEEEDDEE